MFPAPAHLREELGDDKSVGRFLDVLAVSPPAEVIDFLDVLVRAVEAGDVSSHPIGGVPVGNGLPEMGVVVAVEVRDVSAQGVRGEDGRRFGRR